MEEALQGSCRFCGRICDLLIQARTIVEEVAQQHRVPSSDIYSHNRRAYIVAARACAIRRIRDETGLKLTAIGDLFGLDHSTVLYHLNGSGNGARAAATSRQAQG